MSTPELPPRSFQVGVLLLIVALAFAVRFAMLPRHAVVEGDGTHYAALARDVLAGDISGLGNPYWSNLWPGAIALVSRVTGLHVVAAGRWASLLSGTLLVALVGRFGARLFGPTVGFTAALAAAVHPWLVHFSTLVFTESFFTCLTVTLLLVGWIATESHGIASALLAGVLGGMAVVTRPEGFATVLLVLMLLITRCGANRRTAVRSLAILLPLLSLLAVRVWICWEYYDVVDFGIGSKSTANLLIGLAADRGEVGQVTEEVTAEGTSLLESRMRETSVWHMALYHPRLLFTHSVQNLIRIARGAAQVFPPLPTLLGRNAFGAAWITSLQALGILCLAFAILGLACAIRRPTHRTAAVFLLAAGALHLLGLAPLNVHERLLFGSIPLFLIFLAYGFDSVIRRLSRSPLLRISALAAPLFVFGALSVYGVFRSAALAYGDDPPVQKDAGSWIAEHLGPDTRLMTPCPAIAFYALDRAYEPSHKYNEVDMPWLGYDRLLAFAHQHDVAVVAAPFWYLEASHHPSARELLNAASPPPGLSHLVTVGDRAPDLVHLYRVVPQSPEGDP